MKGLTPAPFSPFVLGRQHHASVWLCVLRQIARVMWRSARLLRNGTSKAKCWQIQAIYEGTDEPHWLSPAMYASLQQPWFQGACWSVGPEKRAHTKEG